MSKTSKKERKTDEHFRQVLRWKCLRLNPEYRKYFDSKRAQFLKADNPTSMDSECFMRFGLSDPLPYEYKDPYQAFKKKYPTRDRRTSEKMMEVLLGYIGGIPSVCVELPESLEDPRGYIDGLKQFDDDPKLRDGARAIMEIQLDKEIKITFEAASKKEEVLREVENVFQRIDQLKKLMGRSGPSDKISLLEDALDVYEEITYQGKTMRNIAKAQKMTAEDYGAAYNRVKDRFERAKRYVEEKMYKRI